MQPYLRRYINLTRCAATILCIPSRSDPPLSQDISMHAVDFSSQDSLKRIYYGSVPVEQNANFHPYSNLDACIAPYIERHRHHEIPCRPIFLRDCLSHGSLNRKTHHIVLILFFRHNIAETLDFISESTYITVDLHLDRRLRVEERRIRRTIEPIFFADNP